MTDLAQALPLLQAEFWAYSAVFFRVAAAISLFPGIGEFAVPSRVKIAAALTLTLAIKPTIASPLPTEFMPLLIFTETATGLIFGITLRLFIYALQSAGTIAANAISLAQIFGQNQDAQLPIFGHVLQWAGIALIFISGAHLAFVGYLASSYQLFPIGTVLPAGAISQWGLQNIANSFRLAFQLALPFVAISLLYNLILGAINRAMPQLMVALVGAPFITGAGLALLAITSPLLLQTWQAALITFLQNPF